MFPNQQPQAKPQTQLASQQPRQRQRSWWDKIWKDRRGHIIIYQHPNVWLIAWAVITVISLLCSSTSTANIFWWISMAFLAVWAILEIALGVNYFRRALGAVVLLVTIASAFGIGL